MMLRAVFLGLALSLLCGCAAKPLEVARVTEIQGVAGTVGSDVYAAQRQRGQDAPVLSGDQILPVRAYESKDGTFGEAKGKEIAGASCTVKARYFSADIVTPAKVRVPIYRQYSSPISVNCSKPGYHPRSMEVAVYNKTKADRQNNVPTSAGLIGAVVGTIVVAAINAASDENTHNFEYRPAHITLESIASKSKSKSKKSKPETTSSIN